MLWTVALVLAVWWILGVGVAIIVGRFISLADSQGMKSPPGERHA